MAVSLGRAGSSVLIGVLTSSRGELQMEANRLLNESLRKFDERFVELAQKFSSELRPLGETIASIKLQPEPFVENLLRFSDAIVTARSKRAELKDLPVPPYDLWLPFKADHVPECDPGALAEASKDFQERIASLARYWKGLVPPLKEHDKELERLLNELVSLRQACNKSCSAVLSIKSSLFESSQTVWDELILRLIPTYVTSEDDFDRLVSHLYMAFDEGLRTDVRKWKHGQPLPAPLPRVAEVLHEGSFRHLGTLRNKTSGHDHKEEAFAVTPIYQELIKKTSIDRDDVTSWQQLQKALLEMLVGVLREVRDCFEETSNVASNDASNSAVAGR